ncbi:Helix-turn-helix [Cupriavidus sp. YR651]|uniref:helix-turn-helix domain-containing protein n=1 Tax=Cupriavidus sp. YR651 TaxID=1855315 RepID=UPI00088F6826|nr:helix-turn-helix transcriptional regulator [Cupriavidus sp. YR651]SDC52506.1 Helix-turn-helix [Cupriavidus sp. YR651]
MSYRELIEKALHGRSVLKAAMDLNIPQPSLRKYCNGERMPPFDVALQLANEAQMDPGEVFLMLAQEEARRSGKEFRGIEMDPLRHL